MKGIIHLLLSHQPASHPPTHPADRLTVKPSQEHLHKTPTHHQTPTTPIATMQLNNALLLTLLPALSEAIGFLQKQDPSMASLAQADDHAGNASGANNCGLTSWDDYGKSTPSSQLPLVADCQKIIDTQANFDKSNEIYNDKNNPQILYQYGSCKYLIPDHEGGGEGER